MRFARIAMCVSAAFALTVKLTGQGAVPPAPVSLQTSEKHHVHGGIVVEPSAGGQAKDPVLGEYPHVSRQGSGSGS